MSDIFKHTLGDIERRVSLAAQKLFKRVALGVLALVMTLLGLSFLTAAAYLALRATMTDLQATLVFGFGFLLLAAVLLVFATRQPREQIAEEPPTPAAPSPDPNALGSTVAFTVAFILARTLSDRKRKKT